MSVKAHLLAGREPLATGEIPFTGIAFELVRISETASPRPVGCQAKMAVSEDAYDWLAYGWTGRWMRTVETFSGTRAEALEKSVYAPRKRNQAQLHVLVCDLAIRGFELEEHRLPESLDELVPDFLARVPTDPFDGQAVKFVKEADQYSVSTIDGSHNGGPFAIVRQTGGK